MSEVRFDVYTARQLGSRAPGASGAKKVGLSPVSGLDAADLQAAIEKLLQLVGQGGAPEAGASRLGVVLLSVDPADPQQPKAVGDNDARMSDARTPEGSAGGDLSGDYPDPSLADVLGLNSGTYERATVTVDAKGRVTSVRAGAAGDVVDASETAKGAVEEATTAEVRAGTPGVLYVPASKLKAELDRRGAVEDFVAPTLINSWANLAGATNPTAGYYKNPFGEVFIKGVVGGGAAGSAMFTLPVGYRPSQYRRFAVDSFNGSALVHGSVVVNPDGSVQHVTGGTAQVHINLPPFRAS